MRNKTYRMRVKKCQDCLFIDRPPLTMSNLDKCPYCGGDSWIVVRPKKAKYPCDKKTS